MFSVDKEIEDCVKSELSMNTIWSIICFNDSIFLSLFNPMFPFYVPENIRKGTGFLLFSRGIEKEDCLKLVNNHCDATVINKQNQNILYQCDVCLTLFHVHDNL